MLTILFICTGNTCRSPMAEAIAQHWIDKGLLGDGETYLAASAGVAAVAGLPPAVETVAVLAARGIEFDGRSKPLTTDMIEHAHVVLAMTSSHAGSARAIAKTPEQAAKIQLLDPSADIDDPLGMGIDAYEALADRLTELIPSRLQEVLNHEDRSGIGSSRS